MVQEREENEGGQLHPDRPGRHAAQSSCRERASLQSDRLLLISAQGSEGRRSLERRLTSAQEPPTVAH